METDYKETRLIKHAKTPSFQSVQIYGRSLGAGVRPSLPCYKLAMKIILFVRG